MGARPACTALGSDTAPGCWLVETLFLACCFFESKEGVNGLVDWEALSVANRDAAASETTISKGSLFPSHITPIPVSGSFRLGPWQIRSYAARNPYSLNYS